MSSMGRFVFFYREDEYIKRLKRENIICILATIGIFALFITGCGAKKDIPEDGFIPFDTDKALYMR